MRFSFSKILFLLVFGLILGFIGCENDAPTRLAILNSTGATVTAVKVTNSDASVSLTFSNITNGATTPPQDLTDGGSFNIACEPSNQCVSGTVNLAVHLDNTVTISLSSGPGIGSQPSGGSGGW